MAHVITGIDVGTHSVKFVCIETGFRKAKVQAAFEQLVPTGPEPLEERQSKALVAGIAQISDEMTCYAAIGGERLAVRRLQFPITDVRKVEAIIPFELEGEIVSPLEDVVFDYEFLARLTSAGERESGCRVVAAAAAKADVASALAQLKTAGVQPRSLFAAPLIYRYSEPVAVQLAQPDVVAEPTVATPVVAPAAEGQPPLILLVDVGASRTNLVVLEDGRPVFARTVLRGGNELTQSLSTAFGATWEQSEEAKRTRGAVSHAGFVPKDAIETRMGEVLRGALSPLVRDVRQTLTSYRGTYQREVDRIFVVGGGAGQKGLSESLAEELGLGLTSLEVDRGGVQIDTNGHSLDCRFAMAEALAWGGARGSRHIDLRKGPFAYKASFSVLRQKGAHLAALAAAILVAVIVDGSMSYSKLHKESEKLEHELERATTELFGRPDTDAESVAKLLKRGFREEMPPIPQLTAYDILNEVSRRVPAKDKIKLDILQLDIRPKKIFLKGTIDSVAAVDEMVTALKEIDCFEDIQKGAITEVSGGEKQFTLNIKSKCP
jgi:general secretion pathway protein L